MENTLKIQMVPGEKEQTVLLGNSFHVLEDRTQVRFQTKNIDKFFQYLTGAKSQIKDGEGNEIPVFVFYDAAKLELEAWPAYVDHTTIALATCSLSAHPMVAILKKLNPATMVIEEFEQFLNTSKSFLTSATRDLMDNIRNLSVEKVINVERQKDQAGNFHFAIKSKAGKNDYEFPKFIEFEFNPIFQIKEPTIKIKFDLYFKWDVVSDSPDIRLMFEFTNPELSMLITEETEKALEGAIKGSWDDEYLYPGDLHLSEQTDEWKYLQNDLSISEHL